MKRRIGIYAGTFDPLHEGHLSFALAAIKNARLENVYFLPERTPRTKPHASPYETRIAAMRTTLNGDTMKLLELPDHMLTIQETIPELETIFPNSQIAFLVGADVLQHMPTWHGINVLRDRYKLIVGVRTNYDHVAIRNSLSELGFKESLAVIIQTDQAHVSSTAIRTKFSSTT